MGKDEIKVLHIDSERGWRGGQQQVIYLYERLLKKGIYTNFVCQPSSKLYEYCSNKGLPSIPHGMKGELDINAAKKISDICKSKGYNILHLHSAHSMSIGLLVKLFHRRLKLIGMKRVDFHISKNFLSRIKYSSKWMDKIVCISDRIKNVLIEDGITIDKLETIHSGIDTVRFDDVESGVRKEFGIPSDNIIIGTIAAVVGHKDYPNLLKAAENIVGNYPNVTFIAVGDGKDMESVKSFASQLNLQDRFIFAGYRSDIGKFLKSFDIFVLASKLEGMGTSLLDAQAVGLPIAATKTGGIPEIIHDGVNGLLAAPQNPQALAHILIKLIEDEELRKNLSANAKQSVEQFSIDKNVEKYLELYKNLLGIDS
jgi:glycosyltransferase involved in cell wall biosynthesis